MIPYIRRNKILELLHQKDIVYLDELVKEINVSDATIRRDLKTLSEEGQIDLLTGGAAKIRINAGEKPLDERVNINKEEKELIGRYAATLVNDGEFIFVGPGTTENAMISHLGGRGITVVTNGAFHVNEIIKNKIDAIILGGRIINDIAVLSGPMAIDQVATMHFDKCFIGCSGISKDRKLTTSDENVALINKEAMKNSNDVFFIADMSKMGKACRFVFGEINENSKLITVGDVPDFLDGYNVINID